MYISATFNRDNFCVLVRILSFRIHVDAFAMVEDHSYGKGACIRGIDSRTKDVVPEILIMIKS